MSNKSFATKTELNELDPSLIVTQIQDKSLLKYSLYEDFIANDILGNTLKFASTVSGAGAAASFANIYNVSGLTENLGILTISTGTTATGRVNYLLQSSLFRFGVNSKYFCAIVRIPVLPVVAQDFVFQIGFLDTNTTSVVVDGAYFQVDIGSSNFKYVTSNNSTKTTNISTVPVNIANYYKLECLVNSSGTSAVFSINGLIVGTITTNIPIIAGRETSLGFGIYKVAGTTARTALIDYIKFESEMGTSR